MASNRLLCVSVSFPSSLEDTHIFFPGLTFFFPSWLSVLTPFAWNRKRHLYAIGRPYLFRRTRRSVPVTGEKDSGRDWGKIKILKPKKKENAETSLWSTRRDELIGVTRSAFIFWVIFWPEILVQRRKKGLRRTKKKTFLRVITRRYHFPARWVTIYTWEIYTSSATGAILTRPPNGARSVVFRKSKINIPSPRFLFLLQIFRYANDLCLGKTTRNHFDSHNAYMVNQTTANQN